MCYSAGMTISLTEQQQAGLDKVAAWYPMSGQGSWSPPFRWFGYAGTGKTFTAARIPEHLGLRNVVFGTYTGKAASVLRKSLNRYGVDAPVSTIHSAIYYPTTSAEARRALEEARDELKDLQETYDEAMTLADPQRTSYVIEQGWADPLELAGALSEVSESIPQLEANARRLRFEINPDSDWAGADLIVLDEVSMVNAKLAADIESFGVPILVLGDPAQLPPVEGGGYYTDAEPDHLLTDIQRQALESPVTALATRVRQSQDLRCGLTSADRERPSLSAALDHDVVLCWTNKRRWALINAMRKRLGRPEGEVVAGDTVMVLTNNSDAAVFNGEIFTVLDMSSTSHLGPTLLIKSDTGATRELPVFSEGFQGQDEQARAKNSGMGLKGRRVLATFAQAITVHKAQGSEWDSVYLVDETSGMIAMTEKREGRSAALEQARRWLYTGATRAKERLTIAATK